MVNDNEGVVKPGLVTRLSRTLQAAWRADAAWLLLLWPLSLLHRLALSLRRQLFLRGFRAVYRAPVPVVVVGNISVGGTGKTPVVIALARALRARGLRVGIVSRGYGASRGRFPRRVTPESAWRDAGDEPLMIARQTGCPVVIAPRRADAVRALLSWQSPQVVISDDGLQHLALARDLEIAVLDAAMGIGNGRLLPAGPLRESAARLDDCDWILQRDSRSAARHFRYRVDALVHMQTGDTRPPGIFAGRRVHAVAGIAHPAAFFDSLRGFGMVLSAHRFADHHAFVEKDFSDLDDRPIIMTEKDAVKCESFAGRDFWFLRISAEVPDALVDDVASLLESWPTKPQDTTPQE